MMYRILAKLLAIVAIFFLFPPHTLIRHAQLSFRSLAWNVIRAKVRDLYGMTKKPSKPALKKKSFPHYFRCLHFLLCSLIQHFVDKYAKLLYLPIFLIKAEILHYITSSRSVFLSQIQLYALLLPLLSCNLLCHYMMHKGNVFKVV